jgi:hypothetical protein
LNFSFAFIHFESIFFVSNTSFEPLTKGESLVKTVLRILTCAIWLSSFLAAQTLTLRAGRLLQCTLEEPSLSSKTTTPGEPILCYLRSAREFGRSAFARGSYLTGRFADYGNPGRLAGKGWLKLEFDRLILPGSEIPIAAKVISVRRFQVDEDGKIIGRGHAKRDALAWSLPILWPIDVIRLPGRGPRPTLSGEVPIVLRLMDDVDIPCESTPSCRASSLRDAALSPR